MYAVGAGLLWAVQEAGQGGHVQGLGQHRHRRACVIWRTRRLAVTVTRTRGRPCVVLVGVCRLCVSVPASLRARLAQSVERKALNLVVVGSSPTLGVQQRADVSQELEDARVLRTSRGPYEPPGRSAWRERAQTGSAGRRPEQMGGRQDGQ